MIALIRLFSTCVLVLAALCATPALAEEEDPDAISPLRLSYVEGDVGFWRNGAEDWTDARLNTPLAAGDALYVDGDGTLELQLGSRAFIRASDDTELSVVNQTMDFLQVKVTSGRVSFDLRSLPTGYSIELNTPNAVFTIERPGYYRVEVDDDVRFITRRGGQATMVPAGGSPMSIYPSEEIVVDGTELAHAETYVAPELDGWDRWNYERTEDIIDTASQRYLSSDIAGAEDLDRYGRWRVVPDYGTVWVPEVAHGWAPYSTGRWVWDPYYQWTWIDDSPWGWAPFHYGRWVYVGNYWAWAPGPVVHRAVYSPALVAFYGVGSGVSISVGASVGWVALSWGEPLVPWWGHSRFVGRPYWGGWGGPRVVNNVVIKNTRTVNVTNIQYVNTRVGNALVAVPRERFGKGYVQTMAAPVQTQKKTLVRGALPIKPEPESVTIGSPGKVRVPARALDRPVVATRPPREHQLPWANIAPRSETRIVKPDAGDERTASPRRANERFITVPKPAREPGRPQFGERAGDERPRPQQPQRYNERRETPPPPGFESRVRGQQEDERREVKPLREFKEFKEAPSPQRFDAPRQDAREPRTAVPEILPRPERDMVPERLMRNREVERNVSPPGRERSDTRAVERREQPRESSERIRAPEQERREPQTPSARIERGNGRGAEMRDDARGDLPGNAANRMYRGAEKKQDSGRKNERDR
jgi:hypothetical protein